MFDYLVNITLRTGIVIIPLFFAGLFGWYIIIKLYIFLKNQEKPSNIIKWEKLVNALETNNIAPIKKRLEKFKNNEYSEFVLLMLDHMNASERHLETIYKSFLITNIKKHSLNLSTVKIIASVAPLMGLLGTVIGMIHTFDIISMYGNSNPVLMADGISEALLTTQAGLVVSFPLLFAQVIFNNKLKKLKAAMNDVITEITHRKTTG